MIQVSSFFKSIKIILFALLITSFINLLTKHRPLWAKYSIQRNISYSFTIQNKTNKVVENAQFWTYAPAEKTSTQKCIKIDASHSYELIKDNAGNQVLRFSFEKIPPFSTKIVTIKANLLLSEKPAKMKIPKSLKKSYILPDRFIESDSPEITALAKKLKTKKPGRTSKKIFNWITTNLEYAGYIKNERGALYALAEKKGDCTEYMDLFVALARASKIPSRGIGGYVISKSQILKPYDYHNWAEFYYKGRWHVVDPQKGIFKDNPSHFIAFKIIGKASVITGDSKSTSEKSSQLVPDFHRFKFEGEGLEARMNK